MVQLQLGNVAVWVSSDLLIVLLLLVVAVLVLRAFTIRVRFLLRDLQAVIESRTFAMLVLRALTGRSSAAVLVELLKVFIKDSRRSPRLRDRGRFDWFSWAVFLVPRRIREPWLGDLREDRSNMARAGAPRWYIEACTVSQLLVLAGQILRALVVDAVDAAARRLG